MSVRQYESQFRPYILYDNSLGCTVNFCVFRQCFNAFLGRNGTKPIHLDKLGVHMEKGYYCIEESDNKPQSSMV